MMNLFIFIGICFIAYILFRNLNTNTFKEGMDTPASTSSSSTSGIAGGVSTYAANIKSQVITMQDTLLINKYRSDYETAILNMDDLINCLMLQTALSVDQSNPLAKLTELTKLDDAKKALNSVMTFVDKSK